MYLVGVAKNCLVLFQHLHEQSPVFHCRIPLMGSHKWIEPTEGIVGQSIVVSHKISAYPFPFSPCVHACDVQAHHSVLP